MESGSERVKERERERGREKERKRENSFGPLIIHCVRRCLLLFYYQADWLMVCLQDHGLVFCSNNLSVDHKA